jgi:superoxide reductase
MQVFRCEVCGTIAEIMHAGGDMACCGVMMKLLEEKTGAEGLEKHKPVIKKTPKGFRVKIGSIPHPMTPEHHIEWVELLADDLVLRKAFVFGVPPEWEFCFFSSPKKVSARAYCNIHGLWKSD